MHTAVCLKGHENPEDHDFCGSCGQLLPRDGIEIENEKLGSLMDPAHRPRRSQFRPLVLVGILGGLAGATLAGIVGAAAIAAPVAQVVSVSPASPPSPGFVPVVPTGVDPNFLRGIHLIAPGEAATVSGAWRVSVAGVNRDATSDLEEISYLNTPRMGLKYVLVRIHLERLGDEPSSPSSDLSFSLMTGPGFNPSRTRAIRTTSPASASSFPGVRPMPISSSR